MTGVREGKALSMCVRVALKGLSNKRKKVKKN